MLTWNQGVFSFIFLCCGLDDFNKENPGWLEEKFLECRPYFSRMPFRALYIVVKFQAPNYNTFRDMNYYLQIIFQSRQTESDAYEPTVQVA